MKIARLSVALVIIIALVVVGLRFIGPVTPTSPTGSQSDAATVSDAVAKVEAFPVFMETRYAVNVPSRTIPLPRAAREMEVPLPGSGTGFLLASSHGPLAVTAEHVSRGPWELLAISDGETVYDSAATPGLTITRIGHRLRLTDLSIRPLRALYDSERDLALFSADSVIESLSQVLTPGTTAAGQRVRLFGFPGIIPEESSTDPLRATPNISMREHIVTSMEQTYFVTEGPEIAPGFSGGPVLNEAGEVVGVILRQTGRQVRCAFIASVSAHESTFATASDEYVE